MKEQIWIDTDMGNDDMMAITMLLAAGANVQGFSTVNGVSSSAKGAENLKSILFFLNKTIPVYEGYAQAIQETDAKFPVNDRQRAEELRLLPTNKIQSNSIQDKNKNSSNIEEILYTNQFEAKSIVVALGPLTNIAKTILKYGSTYTKNIEQLLIMGGGIAQGNVGPEYQAEYNIFLDPEAAKIVFESGVPITLVGIDATDQVPTTQEFQSAIAQSTSSSRYGEIVQSIIQKNDNDFDAYYDQLTVSILLDPAIVIESIKGNINIVLEGEKRGKTEFTKNVSGNCDVVMKVDANLFYKLVQKLI